MTSHVLAPFRAAARGLARLARKAATFPRQEPKPVRAAPQSQSCICGMAVPDGDWRCSEGCLNR